MAEYGISFNVSPDKKHVTAVVVTIDERSIGLKEEINVALAEHPLYPQLERYVRENPSGKATPSAPGSKVN